MMIEIAPLPPSLSSLLSLSLSLFFAHTPLLPHTFHPQNLHAIFASTNIEYDNNIAISGGEIVNRLNVYQEIAVAVIFCSYSASSSSNVTQCHTYHLIYEVIRLHMTTEYKTRREQKP